MIVALDSGDASGKSTQSVCLLEYFSPKFKQTQLMHFPVYDSITGQAIKGYLTGTWHCNERAKQSQELDALVLQSLMVTNRLEYFNTLDEYANNNEYLLVLDRYSASAFAYGLADGLSRDFLDRIHEPLPKPQHYFYLDITVAESFRRRPERQDAYESNRERLEQVRKNYLELFRTSGPSYHIIDGMLPKDEVTQQIIATIEGQ